MPLAETPFGLVEFAAGDDKKKVAAAIRKEVTRRMMRAQQKGPNPAPPPTTAEQLLMRPGMALAQRPAQYGPPVAEQLGQRPGMVLAQRPGQAAPPIVTPPPPTSPVQPGYRPGTGWPGMREALADAGDIVLPLLGFSPPEAGNLNAPLYGSQRGQSIPGQLPLYGTLPARVEPAVAGMLRMPEGLISEEAMAQAAVNRARGGGDPLLGQSVVGDFARSISERGATGREASNPKAEYGLQRLRKYQNALEEDPKVGRPVNKPITVNDQILGPKSNEQLQAQIEKNLTPEQIHAAGGWYKEVRDTFVEHFGEKDAPKYILSFMLSQANASPETGIMNMQRVRDAIEGGLPYQKLPGTVKDVLEPVMAGGTPLKGYKAKLLDFIDTVLGKETRTVMADHPEGGEPAAMDVWMGRLFGYVDPETRNFVAKHNPKLARKLKVDMPGGVLQPHQYEAALVRNKSLTDHLNAQDWMGRKDWTPGEIQAIGWYTMQNVMEAKAQGLPFAIGRSTYTMPLEISPGPGSQTATMFGSLEGQPAHIQRGVTDDVHKVLRNDLQEAFPSVTFLSDKPSTGRWEDPVSGEGGTMANRVVRVLASPEAAQDVMNYVGHVLQQGEMVAWKPLHSGKQNVFLMSLPEFKDPNVMEKMFKETQSILAKNNPALAEKFGGYTQLPGDVPSMAIANLKGANVRWSKKDVDAIYSAAEQAYHQMGLTSDLRIHSDPVNMTLFHSKHDWSKGGTTGGSSYTSAIAPTRRSVLEPAMERGSRRLQEAYREAVEKWTRRPGPGGPAGGLPGEPAGKIGLSGITAKPKPRTKK